MKRSNIIRTTISEYRSKKKLTQLAFTKQCNAYGLRISRSTLAKIEAEIRKVSEKELFVFSKAFGVPIDKLYPQDTLKLIKSGK